VLQKGGGILVKPNDPVDLAEKIEFFLKNDDVVKCMAKLAHANIKENYSLDSMVKSWENLYETILGKEEL